MVQKTFGIKPGGRSTGFESTKSKVHEEENYMQLHAMPWSIGSKSL